PAPKSSTSSTIPAKGTVSAKGELSSLADYARVQCAVEGSDFSAALYKEGLDPIGYARLCERWAQKIAHEPRLRAEYEGLLDRFRGLATRRTTEPLPMVDTIIFPGDKLARVSDFARISRAARQGRFREALQHAGIDHDTFAIVCTRFNRRMDEDKAI